MKRAAIFPYNRDAQILIENRDMISDIIITSVISYQEDSTMMEKYNQESDIYFGVDFEKICDEIDAILICDNIQGFPLVGYYNKIKMAVSKGKDIYISSMLYRQIGGENFQESMLHILNNDWCGNNYNSKMVFDIEVPIISVLGMGENCDKFPLQIKLNRKIKEKGYRVLSICSNPMGKLIGLIPLPGFLYDSKMSLPQKTIQFNHLLYDLIEEKEPDVVVIGYPSGIMPINQYCNNYFGEIPFLISNAVVSDIAIFSTFFISKAEESFFDGLIKICETKFNVPINSFCISQQQYSTNKEEHKVKYRFLSNNFFNENFPDISHVKHKIFGLRDKIRCENIFDNLLDELEENIDVI